VQPMHAPVQAPPRPHTLQNAAVNPNSLPPLPPPRRSKPSPGQPKTLKTASFVSPKISAESVDVQSGSTQSGGPSWCLMPGSSLMAVGNMDGRGGHPPTHDSFQDMTKSGAYPMQPPHPNADLEERLRYVHHQLDSLVGMKVLQGLVFLEGTSSRLQGGTLHMADLESCCLSQLLLLVCVC
jgi:hypothetical protein